MEKNLTSSSVLRTIIYFALPYLLSYFLQTLYGMADLFIVGQFYGVDSITAVANGSQVLHMLTVIIVGLAMGTTVAIGRAVGGRRLEDAAHAIGNTITLFMIVAVVFTAGLLCFVRPIVLFIGTPEEAISDDLLYRYSIYYSVQYYQFYFPGNGRFQKPDVFYRDCLYGKYCT